MAIATLYFGGTLNTNQTLARNGRAFSILTGKAGGLLPI
jgi:hypothetical protein